ncbi:MAG: ACP S-malonyltransferase [Wenzhouxiangellaceae bacterium]|nr:ACP S-malonyltransferase [Wenzhouxiangellaceae bacterium]
MSQSAAIFPGQGSQSVGMLEDLAAFSPLVRQTFDEASSVLGRDLWVLVAKGPAEELNQTRWTQPAMLAADIAVWRVYRSLNGPMPQAMAGHSLGEYSALVASGSMGFDDAVAVVHQRGSLMQAAVGEGEGAMAAILGLDDTEVEDCCRQAAETGIVVPANYNSPGQLVIAGQSGAVELAVEYCRQAGARRAMLLPVSVPAHSPLMSPAVAPLQAALDAIDFKTPVCPVLHNVDARQRAEADTIRAALVEQLIRPVPWTETIRELLDRNIDRFLECGPGRVLSGLGRRIEKAVQWTALESPDAMRAAVRGD